MTESQKILHVFSGFDVGGIQMRLITLLAHWARTQTKAGLPKRDHFVLALNGDYSALENVDSTLLQKAPNRLLNQQDFTFFPGVRSAGEAVEAFSPDLLVTYNWGAIDWAAAARFVPSLPHIHSESGFGEDEAKRPKFTRGLFRTLVLRKTKANLVCSQTLERIAREQWRLPPKSIRYLPDGIDFKRFSEARPGTSSDLNGFKREDGMFYIGCSAPLREVKNLTAMIDAFALALEKESCLRLVIAGDSNCDGPAKFKDHAEAKGLSSKVTFLGNVSKIEAFYPSVDVISLSSKTEQLPNSILQGMAARLPVAAFGAGDIPVMVSEENKPFITQIGNIPTLAEAFLTLARDPALRKKIGESNAAKCAADYNVEKMADAWAAQFDAALAECA